MESKSGLVKYPFCHKSELSVCVCIQEAGVIDEWIRNQFFVGSKNLIGARKEGWICSQICSIISDHSY